MKSLRPVNSDVRWLRIMWIRTRFSVLLFAVVLVISCPGALRSPSAQVPKGWKKIDLTSFSFYAPPDMRNQNVRGIDSAVWEFRSRAMTLNLDYGMYSNDLEFYASQPDYHVEWIRIDGNRAKLATLRMSDADSWDKDRKYVAAVYFPEVNGFKTKLTFWADCVDVATRDSAKNTFLSIRFK